MVKKTKKRKKKTRPLQKDAGKVKPAILNPKTDIKIAHAVLEMLDCIEKDLKFKDSYSQGYQEGLKKAIRIIRKVYAR
jgi:hypothetical protein